MSTEPENPREILTKHGLVAFFDILGYKNILSAHSAEEALKIVNASMLQSLKEAKKQYSVISKPDAFVISDSILLSLPLESETASTSPAAIMFLFFCAALMTSLLTRGLPTRGAISWGEFCFQSKKNQVVFVGEPIVEAIELANSLEIAACALAPSSESKVVTNASRQLLHLYKAPIKSQPKCELYLLKYFFRDKTKTREEMIRSFRKHKKYLDGSSLSKFNNTIQFFKSCQHLLPEN